MIPEKAVGKVLEGTVLAAGPGARTEVIIRRGLNGKHNISDFISKLYRLVKSYMSEK